MRRKESRGRRNRIKQEDKPLWADGEKKWAFRRERMERGREERREGGCESGLYLILEMGL